MSWALLVARDSLPTRLSPPPHAGTCSPLPTAQSALRFLGRGFLQTASLVGILRPWVLVEAQVPSPMGSASFIKLTPLPPPHHSPGAEGRFEGHCHRRGDYSCCNHSECKFQLPTLWVSGAEKPTSALGNVLSHIITQLSRFLPVICKRWAVNPARRRQGRWSLFCLPRCVGGKVLGLLPDSSDSTS